jgi:hypothetical protein
MEADPFVAGGKASAGRHKGALLDPKRQFKPGNRGYFDKN